MLDGERRQSHQIKPVKVTVKKERMEDSFSSYSSLYDTSSLLQFCNGKLAHSLLQLGILPCASPLLKEFQLIVELQKCLQTHCSGRKEIFSCLVSSICVEREQIVIQNCFSLSFSLRILEGKYDRYVITCQDSMLTQMSSQIDRL